MDFSQGVEQRSSSLSLAAVPSQTNAVSLSVICLSSPMKPDEEFQLALFRTPYGENLFLNRVFDLLDEKKVVSLNLMNDKIDFAFRLYDLRQTGFIEGEEAQSGQYRATAEPVRGVTVWYQSHSAVWCECADEDVGSLKGGGL
ncbi:hypothetical protein L3X38_012117 [Prunus dulcis]|uniref:Calcineurin B-like protein n=1 Tax=Prunus dulcis TaxID=3755 RepID=A0AAD4WIQ0_PRUDU|nr:hypothetical protein L3X38_012117 [Prunus dulcis]